jgi:hypothetical protein
MLGELQILPSGMQLGNLSIMTIMIVMKPFMVFLDLTIAQDDAKETRGKTVETICPT